MATQGIILTIQQHTQSDIWLADESQAGRVQAELTRFLENPADPRYLAASWQSGHTNSGLHYQRFPFSDASPKRRAVYGRAYRLHRRLCPANGHWRSTDHAAAGLALRSFAEI